MLSCNKLKDRLRDFLAATGSTLAEFQKLLPVFRAAYDKQYPYELTRTGTPRQRRVGGGVKGMLSNCEDKLLFILGYQRTNPLQTMHAWQFEGGNHKSTTGCISYCPYCNTPWPTWVSPQHATRAGSPRTFSLWKARQRRRWSGPSVVGNVPPTPSSTRSSTAARSGHIPISTLAWPTRRAVQS